MSFLSSLDGQITAVGIDVWEQISPKVFPCMVPLVATQSRTATSHADKCCSCCRQHSKLTAAETRPARPVQGNWDDEDAGGDDDDDHDWAMKVQ